MTVGALLAAADSAELTRWQVLYEVEAAEAAQAQAQNGGGVGQH